MKSTACSFPLLLFLVNPAWIETKSYANQTQQYSTKRRELEGVYDLLVQGTGCVSQE